MENLVGRKVLCTQSYDGVTKGKEYIITDVNNNGFYIIEEDGKKQNWSTSHLDSKESQFLQGYKVYEFTFKNSLRVHYAIAKTKKSLIEYYSEDITDPILKNDIKIDNSLSFADVIPTEKKHGYFSPAKKLEEYLYDFDIKPYVEEIKTNAF